MPLKVSGAHAPLGPTVDMSLVLFIAFQLIANKLDVRGLSSTVCHAHQAKMSKLMPH